MSKFANMMHLLDTEHPNIREKPFPENLRPFRKQYECMITLRLPDTLNPMCDKCAFRDVVHTQGKINELGIEGYMTNQKDGLKRAEHRPQQGITLKEPRTIIIGDGEAFVCRNNERSKAGVFFLNEKMVGCASFMEKPGIKAKKE